MLLCNYVVYESCREGDGWECKGVVAAPFRDFIGIRMNDVNRVGMDGMAYSIGAVPLLAILIQ